MSKKNAGFTFLEVLISASILVVGVLVGGALSMSNSKNLNFDRDKIIASEIASIVMEDLLNRVSIDPELTPGTHTSFYDQTETLSVTPSTYTATWTVTWYTPNVDMMDIKLTINWVGTPQGINFETYRRSR